MRPLAALAEMKKEAEPKNASSLFVNRVTVGILEAKDQSFGEPTTPSSLPIKP